MRMAGDLLAYVRRRTESAIFAADNESWVLVLGNPGALANRRNGPVSFAFTRKDFAMLYTIAVVLIILWVLGLVTSYSLGGLIHILLVIALVSVLLQVISGRR